jgi:hypothetical protein
MAKHTTSHDYDPFISAASTAGGCSYRRFQGNAITDLLPRMQLLYVFMTEGIDLLKKTQQHVAASLLAPLQGQSLQGCCNVHHKKPKKWSILRKMAPF